MKQQEIKFRYILKHKGKIKIVYATLEEIEQGKMDDYLMQKSEKFRNKNNVIARNQYVDRKDKNGKEIYSGDIIVLKMPASKTVITGIIEYNINNAAFQINDGGVYYKELVNVKNIEVIGNITENPKLLNL